VNPELTTTKFGAKKLETSLYRVLLAMLNYFGVEHQCDRDGRLSRAISASDYCVMYMDNY